MQRIFLLSIIMAALLTSLGWAQTTQTLRTCAQVREGSDRADWLELTGDNVYPPTFWAQERFEGMLLAASGRVCDEVGEPLAQRTVRLIRYTETAKDGEKSPSFADLDSGRSTGEFDTQSVYEASTDSKGDFLFVGLPPARYAVTVVGSHQAPEEEPIAVSLRLAFAFTQVFGHGAGER